jgi:hypothetical protein
LDAVVEKKEPSQHSVDEDTADADCVEKKEGEDDDKKKDQDDGNNNKKDDDNKKQTCELLVSHFSNLLIPLLGF